VKICVDLRPFFFLKGRVKGDRKISENRKYFGKTALFRKNIGLFFSGEWRSSGQARSNWIDPPVLYVLAGHSIPGHSQSKCVKPVRLAKPPVKSYANTLK
jgi:hypothetical protein